MPILWAFPEVYMTYKLSEKHPCASGGALWVELAFGERMGLMVGYLGEFISSY
jgi:amino acid transporter